MTVKDKMLKKLVSLRRPKEKAKQVETMDSELGRYPYGTRLDLGRPEVKKLGIEDVQVGKKCIIYAVGEVTSVSTREGSRGKSHDVGIQLHKMSVKPYDTQGRKRKRATSDSLLPNMSRW